MSSSKSAWSLSPLECSPQKQNGWTLRFCFWERIMWKMYNKTVFEFGFRMVSRIIKTLCLCYLPKPNVGFDNSWYHAQPHPIKLFSNITFLDNTRDENFLLEVPNFSRNWVFAWIKYLKHGVCLFSYHVLMKQNLAHYGVHVSSHK